MTRKGRFPPLLARVTCLQQVIHCIAYVAGVERDGGRKGGIRERGFSVFPIALFSPFLPSLFMRLPRRLSTAVNAFRNVIPFAIQTASSRSFCSKICGGVVPRAACCVGACTSVLTPAQHWRCLRFCCSKTQTSHSLTDFRTRAVAGTKTRLLAVFLLSVTKQINGSVSKYSFLIMFIYM